jgi:hypothetical protein
MAPRTRLESVGLIWHVTQMMIVTYLLVGPKRAELVPVAVMMLCLPFAAGWWLAGLLRSPTPNVLLLTALYWAVMALAIQTSSFHWDFRMGIAVHVAIWHAPEVSIDVVAFASATLFAMAWRKRRLTIVGGVRDRPAAWHLGR